MFFLNLLVKYFHNGPIEQQRWTAQSGQDPEKDLQKDAQNSVQMCRLWEHFNVQILQCPKLRWSVKLDKIIAFFI